MSENDSRRPHFSYLCGTSAVLGVASGFSITVALLSLATGTSDGSGISQDELDTKIHRELITGGILAAASLFVGVTGCIPLPGFIYKRIFSSSSDNTILVEHDELENRQSDNNSQESSILRTSHPNDLPPNYQSITENVDTTVIGNIPPPSYADAVSMINGNISLPSYRESVSMDERGIHSL